VKIIVNHLTRMTKGYICVAGVDPETKKHVRPVVPNRLSARMLERNGGPFNMAAVVDLGAVRLQGFPPEVEDHQFSTRRATKILDASAGKFWAMLTAMSRRSLRGIFGEELQRREVRGGWSCALEKNRGVASLGCLLPAGRPKLLLDAYGKVRALVCDGEFTCTVPVTDLRLYERDHETPRREAMEDMNRRMARGVEVILSVGVGQPYPRTGDAVERHWLQVNNVHLRDDPTWKGW
jgi:hypothetical protein